MKQAKREFNNQNINIDAMAKAAEQFFKEESFKTQSAKHPKGWLIQATKGGIFRSILGMDRAFTITISGDSNNVTVSMGIGKWLQDLGVAAIEAFLLTPLVVFVEVPESLWSFEIEHHFWHYLENQVSLGLQ
jgi:hypothetical protein